MDEPTPPPPPPPWPEKKKRFGLASLPKNALIAAAVVTLSVAGASAAYLVIGHSTPANSKSSTDYRLLEKELSELKKKYDELEADRNNVLSQTKNLLQEKSKWVEVETQVENLRKTNKVFMGQKEKLLADNQRIKNEIGAVIQNFDSLKESYQELLTKQEQSDKENAELRRLLTEQVQNTPEFQTLDREAKRLREENLLLGQTITSMEGKLKLALDRIKKDQQREVSYLRQVHSQKDMLDELRAHNEFLTKTNRELNELINQAPGRIKQMAAQNMQLLKETAEMHYNMGVFFTENKKFDRAEREYLRALEFDPNSSKVHYNLGYLYAEELEKHDKAMLHLEKYLQINPNSKESESIRSYIATRQTWNGGLGKR